MSRIMKVSPVKGEKWRYYVFSESEDNAEHIVDLSANNGNGECSCRDFETRRGPNFHRNGKLIVDYSKDERGKVLPEATYCKHIALVRNHLLNSILPDMVSGADKKTKPVTVRKAKDGLPF